MLRTITTASLLVVCFLCFGLLVVPAGNAGERSESVGASGDTVSTETASGHAAHMTVEEFSAQSRRILRSAPRRVRIYRQYLGPNAVRICNARYEQEYRPSGTVIVPRMQCYWQG